MLLLATSFVAAQPAISTKAGLIYEITGDVRLDGEEVVFRGARYPAMRAGTTLSTGEGTATVLLTPGASLELSERSSIQMVAGDLDDAVIRIVSGSVRIRCRKVFSGNRITVAIREARVGISDSGKFSLDATNGTIEIQKGKVLVTRGLVTEEMRSPMTIHLGGRMESQIADTPATRPARPLAVRRVLF